MAAGHVRENTLLPEAENVSAKNLWIIAWETIVLNKLYNSEIIADYYGIRSSAQSLAEKVKGAEVSTADPQMASQVPDVTRNSNLQLKKPVTSDRVRIGWKETGGKYVGNFTLSPVSF